MIPDLAPDDAVVRATELGSRVDAATQRLLRTAAAISGDQARRPSLLPGWTRGHVLTHIARNADGLRNLLIWARTGTETPMYPGPEARNADIAAGAGRPAHELHADLRGSAQALAAEAGGLTAANWVAEVHGIRGKSHPAWYTMWRRLQEVEIHHADLDAGYGPGDWPQQFAAEALERVAGDMARPDAPAAILVSSDSGRSYRIGPPGSEPATEIRGSDQHLLAWLTGRSAGPGLAAKPAGPLPSVPAW